MYLKASHLQWRPTSAPVSGRDIRVCNINNLTHLNLVQHIYFGFRVHPCLGRFFGFGFCFSRACIIDGTYTLLTRLEAFRLEVVLDDQDDRKLALHLTVTHFWQ